MSRVHESAEMFPVHHVPATRPFVWLMEGWDSLIHCWPASLAHGALVAMLGSLILAYKQHPLYIATAICAFLVIGPVITAGICELSRCRDHGEPCDFSRSLAPLSRNRASLMMFAQVLVFVSLGGFALAALFLYNGTGQIAPAIETTVWGDVARHLTPLQTTTYTATFIVLATGVFLLSVVSVPMIIDRHVDAGTAMRMSLKVALRDFPAMLVWAGLIIALVAFGFGTRLVGMAFVVPLLGHATWFAYRDIVSEA
ncbi:hypothetical protein A3709_17270 [Halioglobus sp. HI00S01]|uniref:DUF2189 domain-containing protein n=1 Tax=Halioglobus sp. HI00S01 TaxID=1822214 RepID=UPI0007C28A25|nr:DUF2189 domain-containing protein [Halioglobus sp. HI00S01]KZX58748.1 hypothetical protein A3709_17270 [Halioglobus sp. HI00S01]